MLPISPKGAKTQNGCFPCKIALCLNLKKVCYRWLDLRMNAGCAGETVRSLKNACMGALEVCSRRGAIQIHVYLYLTFTLWKRWDAGLKCKRKLTREDESCDNEYAWTDKCEMGWKWRRLSLRSLAKQIRKSLLSCFVYRKQEVTVTYCIFP